MVALRRRSFIRSPEITSFVILVLFDDRGRRVSLRFYLFVSDFNQGSEEVKWVQDLLV